MLHTVTISGADDAVDPQQLLALQRQFPFVEWGILLSQARMGTARYPTADWILECYRLGGETLRWSGHLCGQWAQLVSQGQPISGVDITLFDRLQLNGIQGQPTLIKTHRKKQKNIPYILQVRRNAEKSVEIARQLQAKGIPVGLLFDASGGRGITPTTWPPLPSDIPSGIAGGLGPQNLQQHLTCFSQQTTVRPQWIDLESNVRSEQDQFSLEKVQHCLHLAQAFI